MNKLLSITLVLTLSLFIVGCDATNNNSSDQYSSGGGSSDENIANGNGSMGDSENLMGGNGDDPMALAGDDGDDPMALAGSGGDAGGDPLTLLMGGSGDGSKGGGARFQEMGTFNAYIGGVPYNYISASDTANQIIMSAYTFDASTGMYIVQIVGYDIKEDRLNPAKGYLMIKFAMPDISVTGTYPLLYPENQGGTVQVTETESFNDAFEMKGTINDVVIPAENNATVEGYGSFNVTVINLQKQQQ